MSAEAQRILLLDDASPGISLDTIKYALQGSSPGTKLMLLAVLHEISNPMGFTYKMGSGSWIGASPRKVREEVARKREEYINNGEIMKVTRLCKSLKIELVIDVQGGDSPKEVVRKAAKAFRPTWIIFNKKMEKEKDYLFERLSCKMSIVKHNNTIEELIKPKARNLPMRPIGYSRNLIGSDESDTMSRHYSCSSCYNRRPKMGWKGAFAYEVVEAATKGFSQKISGDFGVAYRGKLNGLKITVKQHKRACYQGSEKRCRSDIHMLMEVRHENVAMLLGNTGRFLRWDKRMKIALGAAKGLKYLHENNIIHRNLRPDNILLTHDFEPLLGDFGLEMILYEDSDFSSEMRNGTMPYLAPEYADSGEVSSKSDCYSFGVILLHLITGLRSTEPQFGEQSIVEWAKLLLKEKNYAELIKHNPIGSDDAYQLAGVIQVAVKCLHKNPYKRMSMDQVVYALNFSPAQSDSRSSIQDYSTSSSSSGFLSDDKIFATQPLAVHPCA